jgi:hypothetical protein
VGTLETLMDRNRSQGAASYTANGRDMGEHSRRGPDGWSIVPSALQTQVNNAMWRRRNASSTIFADSSGR